MYPKRQGRFDQDENENRSYFTPRYNQQRNNNNRFGGNQNRQRNQNRMGSDSEQNWRHNGDNSNRQTYQLRSPNNSFNRNNRNDTNENSVIIQTLVTEPEARKIVSDYRKELIKDFNDSIDGTIENDKIVYSCECIVKLGEIVDEPLSCPLVYSIYEKKLAEIEEDCWDTSGEFSLDNGVDLIERGRVEFLERKREEQFLSMDREQAEVEEQLEQLEVEANGGSIFEMLSQRGILSQSPLPDPREEEEIEGAIDGIVPPDTVENPNESNMEGEVVTEADVLRAYQEKQLRKSGVSSPIPEDGVLSDIVAPHSREDFGYQRHPSEYPGREPPGYMNHRMGMNYPNMSMGRPHEMNPNGSYIPNRYFHQMYNHQQPDLFQMVEETDRQQQMYRVHMNSMAQQQLRQHQLDQLQYPGQDVMNMRMAPERQGMRDGMHMMYGHPSNPGMDRYNHYSGRGQDPMFNRMNNERPVMNYRNYGYYQGNQDSYYPYGY